MDYSAELRDVVERVMWFENAEDALQYPKRFLAYLMTFGTLDEILIARRYFSDPDFEAVLADPPPGIFDPRSWTYWNVVYHRRPIPPLTERVIPA